METIGKSNGCRLIERRNVFLVRGVADQSSLGVIGRVLEIHAGVGGLIVVVAPAIENVFAVAVQVHEETDAAKGIEEPLGVTAFRFRECRGPVVHLIVARAGGVGNGSGGTKERWEVPKEIVVAVDVDADTGVGIGSGGASIFAPPSVGVQAEVAAVRIGLRKHEDVECVDDSLNVGGGEGLASEGEAGAAEVGLLQLFDKVDENVGAAPLAGVNAAEEVDAGAARAAAVGDLDGVTLPAFPGQVRQGDELGEACIRG